MIGVMRPLSAVQPSLRSHRKLDLSRTETGYFGSPSLLLPNCLPIVLPTGSLINTGTPMLERPFQTFVDGDVRSSRAKLVSRLTHLCDDPVSRYGSRCRSQGFLNEALLVTPTALSRRPSRCGRQCRLNVHVDAVAVAVAGGLSNKLLDQRQHGIRVIRQLFQQRKRLRDIRELAQYLQPANLCIQFRLKVSNCDGNHPPFGLRCFQITRSSQS